MEVEKQGVMDNLVEDFVEGRRLHFRKLGCRIFGLYSSLMKMLEGFHFLGKARFEPCNSLASSSSIQTQKKRGSSSIIGVDMFALLKA